MEFRGACCPPPVLDKCPLGRVGVDRAPEPELQRKLAWKHHIVKLTADSDPPRYLARFIQIDIAQTGGTFNYGEPRRGLSSKQVFLISLEADVMTGYPVCAAIEQVRGLDGEIIRHWQMRHVASGPQFARDRRSCFWCFACAGIAHAVLIYSPLPRCVAHAGSWRRVPAACALSLCDPCVELRLRVVSKFLPCVGGGATATMSSDISK